MLPAIEIQAYNTSTLLPSPSPSPSPSSSSLVAGRGNKFPREACHRDRPDKNYKATIGRFGNSAGVSRLSSPAAIRVIASARVLALTMRMHLSATCTGVHARPLRGKEKGGKMCRCSLRSGECLVAIALPFGIISPSARSGDFLSRFNAVLTFRAGSLDRSVVAVQRSR